MKIKQIDEGVALSRSISLQPQLPKIRHCPLCHGKNETEFFHLENVPLFCNVVFDSKDDAIAAKRADIRLNFCNDCGYIYNASFDPGLMQYIPGYENSQHFSPQFRQYAKQLAEKLVDQLNLNDKRIIEIGCGDGYFLKEICRQGQNKGIGFDPSMDLGSSNETAFGTVKFRKDFYGPKYANEDVNLICCRHVLEHVDDPVVFLQQVRDALGQRKYVRLYFEVPNTLQILQGSSIWDILYEHKSYFLRQSLENLFLKSGFEPLSTWSAFGEQFLAILARPTSKRIDLNTNVAPDGRIISYVKNFESSFYSRVAYWQSQLSKLVKAKKKVVFWGAGSKGITLLNTLEDSDKLISFIVDVNLRKQGKYLPVTGQKIVASEFLCEYQPHDIVVMNPVYMKEISEILGKNNIRANLLLA